LACGVAVGVLLLSSSHATGAVNVFSPGVDAPTLAQDGVVLTPYASAADVPVLQAEATATLENEYPGATIRSVGLVNVDFSYSIPPYSGVAWGFSIIPAGGMPQQSSTDGGSPESDANLATSTFYDVFIDARTGQYVFGVTGTPQPLISF
jgi:hypothetical protein